MSTIHKKYQLIKEYPNSPKMPYIVEDLSDVFWAGQTWMYQNRSPVISRELVLNSPEYWEEIIQDTVKGPHPDEASFKEMVYQRSINNPYSSEGQSHCAYEKGFEECWQIFFKSINTPLVEDKFNLTAFTDIIEKLKDESIQFKETLKQDTSNKVDDWQVISFKSSSGSICSLKENGKYSYENQGNGIWDLYAMLAKYPVYSVRRISSNEIFTLSETVIGSMNNFIIEAFTQGEYDIRVHGKHMGDCKGYMPFKDIKKLSTPASIEEKKEVLFTHREVMDIVNSVENTAVGYATKSYINGKLHELKESKLNQ